MKISFGCIVFNILDTLPNGMFEKCVENVYDFAHEIIIVEGATGGSDGCTESFTKDGHSSDGTLEYLVKLQLKYNKIKIIRSNRFWNNKTEMCNAYAKFATGDYIWQLDSDEFYHKEDMEKIVNLLEKERPDAVHFYANHFFGDFDHCINESGTNWANQLPWMRIFRHIPGKSKWLSHEPPNFMCDRLICNNGKVITRSDTFALGITMYHYSYVCKNQIDFKEKFYRDTSYSKFWRIFQANANITVFGDHVSKFSGRHPIDVSEML